MSTSLDERLARIEDRLLLLQKRLEPRREADLEEFLGGCIVALVGGLAVLVGLAFLVVTEPGVEHRQN
jgi:hypothetical protein